MAEFSKRILLLDDCYSSMETLPDSKVMCIAYGNLWRSKYTLAYVKDAIGYDGHSFNRERVNGVVRNSDAWYELFDIKPGDALCLAPEKRAYIW
jgi:predicted metalloendopeptidase